MYPLSNQVALNEACPEVTSQIIDVLHSSGNPSAKQVTDKKKGL